ncbi:phosphopantetheine-binding protein [Paenibacillus caseinilyticus]
MDQVEQNLVEIWEQILGTKGVGTHYNFFDIGGNSMSLIRMHVLIEPMYACVTVTHLFAYPSISRLAEFIRQTTQQEQVPVVQAIPYAAEYFAADRGQSGGTLSFNLEGELLASIQEATQSLQLKAPEIMLALFLYLQAELTEQEQITMPVIAGRTSKIQLVTLDMGRIEQISDLFRMVRVQLKDAAAAHAGLMDLDFMRFARREQALVPGFMCTGASTLEMRFAEKCDLLIVLHEHPAQIYVECMYNARLNKAKITEMMQQYVQVIESLVEQLEPSKG